MPKTQSALLEAMAEHQVTVDGTTRSVPAPFFLMATENPIEQEGTFPLPEAQLDRFFLKTELGYPNAEEELEIVRGQREEHPINRLRPVVALDDVVELQHAIEDVFVHAVVLRWIVDLVRATREIDETVIGGSVRASLALERVARARALLDGRDFVQPADVEALFLPVVGHRVAFTPTFLAEARRLGRDEALAVFQTLVLRAGAAPRARPGARAAGSRHAGLRRAREHPGSPVHRHRAAPATTAAPRVVVRRAHEHPPRSRVGRRGVAAVSTR